MMVFKNISSFRLWTTFEFFERLVEGFVEKIRLGIEYIWVMFTVDLLLSKYSFEFCSRSCLLWTHSFFCSSSAWVCSLCLPAGSSSLSTPLSWPLARLFGFWTRSLRYSLSWFSTLLSSFSRLSARSFCIWACSFWFWACWSFSWSMKQHQQNFYCVFPLRYCCF